MVRREMESCGYDRRKVETKTHSYQVLVSLPLLPQPCPPLVLLQASSKPHPLSRNKVTHNGLALATVLGSSTASL